MELNPDTPLHLIDGPALLRLGVAAVIGIACGAALWPLVVSATVIAMIVLSLLGILERRWLGPQDRKE